MLELKVYLNGRLLTTEYMTADVCTIGRLPESDISLQNPAVSRRHAELREVDGAYLLRDLDSSNGVKVNGERVESVEVKAGDRIEVGTYEIVVGSTALGAHSDSMAATYAYRVALPRRGPGLAVLRRGYGGSVSRARLRGGADTPLEHRVLFASTAAAEQAGRVACPDCVGAGSHGEA